GSAGIQLAYEQALTHFVEGGTNRVILCTDGDLNVGITEDDELVKLITEKATSGVFLTVLGFGTGNLKDSKMEKLADKGNGIYAYIDGLREARKVLVEQVSGSLITIAKDVKLQIEFYPAEVASYRLIGYENRTMAAKDFRDDKKDAGEIGAGHTVTALYEVVPAGAEETAATPKPGLKYQKTKPAPDQPLSKAARNGKLLTLWLRYKQPDGQESSKLKFTLRDDGHRFSEASVDFRFASAVASFGMVLRGSGHAGDATMAAVEEFAAGAIGEDPQGYRAEFVDLVRRARKIRGQ
ncbi:MAG: YfbK domain-containing protein, partial [Thermoguttaceae bacterium]